MTEKDGSLQRIKTNANPEKEATTIEEPLYVKRERMGAWEARRTFCVTPEGSWGETACKGLRTVYVNPGGVLQD